MTTPQERAEALLADMKPFCEKAELISASEKHIQVRVHRNSVQNPSALFSDDSERLYPFDEWSRCQTDIKWSSWVGRHWMGTLKDGVRITIVIEK